MFPFLTNSYFVLYYIFNLNVNKGTPAFLAYFYKDLAAYLAGYPDNQISGMPYPVSSRIIIIIIINY